MTDARIDFLDGHSLRRRTVLATAMVGLTLVAGLAVLPGAPASGAIVALALYAAVSIAVCQRIEPYHPHARFGVANAITLMRAGGTALLAGGLAAPDMLAGPPAVWMVLVFALGLLVLDGADGWAARRQGLNSRFGARFDMEIDTLLLLVLAGYVVALGKVGPWVLAIGLPRYAFVAAGLLLPVLRCDLPPSLRRKAVCVLQITVLAALLAPPVTPPLAPILAAAALAALLWSFARDIAWLMRHGR